MSKNEPTARNSTEVDTTRSDVDAFLAEMTKASASGISGTGRLIFALDATNSRHETWDMACQLQGDMFRTVATVGGLKVQLVSGSAAQLGQLLKAVAVFAVGGVAALEASKDAGAVKLLSQLK